MHLYTGSHLNIKHSFILDILFADGLTLHFCIPYYTGELLNKQCGELVSKSIIRNYARYASVVSALRTLAGSAACRRTLRRISWQKTVGAGPAWSEERWAAALGYSHIVTELQRPWWPRQRAEAAVRGDTHSDMKFCAKFNRVKCALCPGQLYKLVQVGRLRLAAAVAVS